MAAVLVVAILSVLLTGCATSRNGGLGVTPAQKLLRKAVAQEERRTGKKAVYTHSGVAIIDIGVGVGKSPKRSDEIYAHYVGWLPDGTKFESSYDRGRPGKFRVSDVVPGCADGLVTMKVGGKRKIFVPAHLAYGTNRRPASVPPNSPLIYEFLLISIE